VTRALAVCAGVLAALLVSSVAWAGPTLDHVMLGVSDLALGGKAVEALTGVSPRVGGVHPGRGTANALMSLGGRTYLEVIAPAPGQPIAGPMAQQLAALKAPDIRTFAMATSDLEGVAAAARRAGLTVEGPDPGSRRTPDGQLLQWRTLGVGGHDFGGFVPFFIDWGTTPHPATTSPAGVELTRFRVIHPRAVELRRIYQALGLGIEVTAGVQPLILVELKGPNGPVVLSGDGAGR
jgi:glyoxalase-like protein